MEQLNSKTPQELGISNAEYISLAESLLLSREIAAGLPNTELGQYHAKRAAYLEQYFGLREAIDSEQ